MFLQWNLEIPSNFPGEPSSHAIFYSTKIPFSKSALINAFVRDSMHSISRSGPVRAQSASEEDMLVEKARFTLENFLSDPDMQWFRDHMKEARVILIVPQFIKGAFFIGGSGGGGVLVVRDEKTNEWSYPAFFTVGGASSGLHLAAKLRKWCC